tara:strand:+ start:107 stop:307 length:201 start_codon:yes stop_codon:yes gene_type:complete
VLVHGSMGVSAEHWLHNQSDHSEHLIFLDVDPSLTVIVSQEYLTVVKRDKYWCMGYFIPFAINKKT